jgi:hypothetical protein
MKTKREQIPLSLRRSVKKPLFLRQQGIAGKTSLPTLRGAPDHDPCAN